MVRIRFPPAASPCLTQTRPLQVENRGFRAGARCSVGGAVDRDAQGSSTSRQLPVISLSAVTLLCFIGLGLIDRPAASIIPQKTRRPGRGYKEQYAAGRLRGRCPFMRAARHAEDDLIDVRPMQIAVVKARHPHSVRLVAP